MHVNSRFVEGLLLPIFFLVFEGVLFFDRCFIVQAAGQMFVVGNRFRSSEDECAMLRAELEEAKAQTLAHKKVAEGFNAKKGTLRSQVKQLETDLKTKDDILSVLERDHDELLRKTEALQGEVSNAKEMAVLEFKSSEDFQDDTCYYYVVGLEHFRKRAALALGDVQD